MSDGFKVTRIALEGAVIPSTVSVDATYTGDDADFDGTPGVGGQDQWKQPVRCATTASITISTALNNGDTLDGVTLATGDRVLVKNQGTASQNGIYVVGTTPARAADMDDDLEVLGAVVYVIAGTANAGTTWTVTNTAATVVDTDAINWAALEEPGLAAHIADATDAHDASAVSVLDTAGNFTGTDVEAVLAELQDNIDAVGGILSNYAATTDPAVTDDSGDGYSVGSRWINTSTDEEWVATDVTVGAAVWVSTTDQGAGSGVATDAIWDAAGDLAVGSGANTAARLAVGSEGDVLSVSSGVPAWVAPGSGAFTHAYVGYNTVGGSTENVVTRRQIMKKVTLAADCLVTSIDVYVKQITTGASVSLAAGILTDSGGSPALLIAKSADDGSEGMFLSTANGTAGAARWVSKAMGVWLVAGDYWLAVEFTMLTANAYQVYYDGSGGDRYYTNNADSRMSDSGWTTVTTSSNKYSIRASTIS